MTPTEQIESWIKEHGCVRDALNVALARLAAAERALAFREMTNVWGEQDEANAELGEAVRAVIYSEGTGRLFTNDKASGVRRTAEALERDGYLPAAQVLYAIHDVLKKEQAT